MGNRLIVLLGLLLTGTVCQVYAYDDNDFQVWNTDVEEFSITKKVKGVLEEEFRWADNASEYCYQHYDAGISYALSKRWSLGGGYRHINELKRGKFRQEAEPYVTATFSLNMAGFAIEDRSRLEYREFAYQADSGRYRNKLTVKSPWKFTALKLQPYLADEVFFSIGGFNGFNQNRFSSGIALTVCRNVKAEVYYLLQTAKSSGRWTDTNVLGTKLKVSF